MRTSEEAKDIIREAIAWVRPEFNSTDRRYLTEQILRKLQERGYIIRHLSKMPDRYDKNAQ